jgi:hypothetical protein
VVYIVGELETEVHRNKMPERNMEITEYLQLLLENILDY